VPLLYINFHPLLMTFAYRKTLALFLILTGLLFSHRARAQDADTLALAHKLTDEKAFVEATNLLASYEKTHPANTDAVRLHLQLLYWQHQLPAAAELYHRAIGQQPAATGLLLDYGRILYETKQYPQAETLLGALLQSEPDNAEALTMLGIMSYYEGKLPLADSYLTKVLATHPGDATAQAFAQKLRAERAPYLQLRTTYRADDQPLYLLENKVEVGVYRSSLLAPSLQAVLWDTRDSIGGFRQHIQLLAGNKSTLLNQKLVVQLNAGIFKHAAQGAPSFVGLATLHYKLPKGFALEASGSRSPYLYTIGSSREAVLTGQVYGALLFQSPTGWQGQAQFTENYLPGSNRITGLSAWLLSRALVLGPVYVKGGYSFSYNDALYSTYSPLLGPSRVVAAERPIAGTYGAYFTPEQQLIHSLLLNTDIKVGSRCWVLLKGSVGVFAHAQNPYLFLNGDAAAPFIDQGFYTEHYTPYEVKGQVSYSLSAHVGLEGGYGHMRSFFYTANQAFTNLKFSF
jgi:tetratricopeptide (TPR) repeat protein